MDPPSFNLDSPFSHRGSRSSATDSDGLSKSSSNPIIKYEPPTPAYGRTSFSRSSIGLDSYSMSSNSTHRPSLNLASLDPASGDVTTGSLSRGIPCRTQTDPNVPLLDPFSCQLDQGESIPSSASDASSPGFATSPTLGSQTPSSDTPPTLVRRSPILPEAQLSSSAQPKKSPGKSHSRKVAPGHIKRPRNAFILFRSHTVLQGLVPKDVEKDHRNISRIISHMWKSLSEEERQVWNGEAEKEKAEHKRLYPEYKYKPLPPPPGKKKTLSKSEITSSAAEKNCEEIADSILKAHGHSGIIRSAEGKPTLSRTASKRKERSAAAERAAPAKNSRRNRSRTATGGTSRSAEKSISRSTRGISSDIQSNAILSEGALVTSVPETFYAPGELLWNRTSLSKGSHKPSSEGAYSPPAFPQGEFGDYSGLSNRPQTSHDVGGGSSLFGGWSERLREAGVAEGQNQDSNSAPNSASLIKTQSPSSLSQTPRRKERPQAFNLEALSSATSFTPLSPTSVPFELQGGGSIPTFSTNNFQARPETAGGLVTPRGITLWNLRHRGSASERMLISPLRSSFGDIRKLSASWSKWDKQLEASSIPIPTRIRYSQIGLHGNDSAGMSQSIPGETNMEGLAGICGDESGDALFAQAAQEAAATLHADSLLSDPDIDVFSFRPEFLEDPYLEGEGDEGLARVATGTSSRRPDTANNDDGPPQRFDPDMTWNMTTGQTRNQFPFNGSVGLNGDRRRSVIDGIKTAIGAAAVQAAEKVRKDSLSSGREAADLNTNELSQQLIRRWRASFSNNSGSALQPHPSTNLGTLSEEISSEAETNQSIKNVINSSSSGNQALATYHIDDTLMFDAGQVLYSIQSETQPPAQGLAPRRPVDLFAFMNLDRTQEIPPVQWNLYGLQSLQTPVDMSLLDAAFTELEREGF